MKKMLGIISTLNEAKNVSNAYFDLTMFKADEYLLQLSKKMCTGTKVVKSKTPKQAGECQYLQQDITFAKTSSNVFQNNVSTESICPPNAIQLIAKYGIQNCEKCFIFHTPCRKFCKKVNKKKYIC